MLSTALDSARLFFTGRLFRDNAKVMRQLVLGAAAGALVVIVVGQVAPFWAAAAAGGAVSGFLQPFLFKDLKYA
ncbi:hypothetical protein SAMN06265365_13739 [Tistlia consotensis]|uniref:Uncharacterized protein n=1 Tax=Tistlia consotensis USBA 355 TaxID=560819 RepID=A0A1Y6BVZ6_9PROT|nr:hypothetical protein [Tistlia consotensis]SMF30661.1 hypothetical protein SAMN05428998_110124 [Tistlia consotensis USBA 355]SNS19807.1 hypothetical protein SAMN06265365_13739 [Tistlia consotensis]